MYVPLVGGASPLHKVYVFSLAKPHWAHIIKYLHTRAWLCQTSMSCECAANASPFLHPSNCRMLKIWVMRGIQSVLRMVEIGMAYILMFLAMTFNGWLFLSVCVGAGIGNLIFSPFHSSIHESQDHCGWTSYLHCVVEISCSHDVLYHAQGMII